MRGFEVLAKSRIEGINVEDHALCSGCKRVVCKDDCTVCVECSGYTCDRCAHKGRFTCCLAACLESAAIEGDRILESELAPS